MSPSTTAVSDEKRESIVCIGFNVGTGVDQSILELAGLIREVVGYGGKFVFDASKPDGTPRKLLDVSRLAATGWRPRFALRDAFWSAMADLRAAARA